MKKQMIIWTKEERETVALRGMELFSTSDRTLNQSFYEAQFELLPEDRRRSRGSLSKSLDEMEILGEQLLKEKREAEEAATASAPVANSTPVQTSFVSALDLPSSVAPAMPQLPLANSALFDNLIGGAVNVMVDEFKSRLEGQLSNQLNNSFLAIEAQMASHEAKHEEILKRLDHRVVRLSTAKVAAEDFEKAITASAKRMAETIDSVEARYKEITSGVDSMTKLADKEMAKFMRLHDRVQADLIEMQRMLEANSMAMAEAQNSGALATTETEPVAEPTKRRAQRRPKAPAEAPRVLIVGLDGDQLTIMKKEFGEMLNLTFHSKETSKKLASQARNADYVIMSKFVDHGIYEVIKDHPGYKASMGGMTQIKDLLLEIACK